VDSNFEHLRIALVIDQLTQMGGSEKVTQSFLDMFPQADIFTSFYNPELYNKHFSSNKIHASYLQRLWKLDKFLVNFIPNSYPSFDFQGYDLIISNTANFAKNIICPEQAIHVCYLASPPRYLWQNSFEYIDQMHGFKKMLAHVASLSFGKMRQKDYFSAQRVDGFICNSRVTQGRCKKYYKRESSVVHPPVETTKYTPTFSKKDYFLAGGRHIGYKRFDLIVHAFNELKLPLKIFGSGPLTDHLKSINVNPDTEFLGLVKEESKIKLFEEARAFIFPTVEDFGIVPVEAMSSGTPVIAIKKGGVTESVIDNCGVFFEEQTVESLIKGVKEFQDKEFSYLEIARWANQFSEENFHKKIKKSILNLTGTGSKVFL
jgi:glycosyltransferase involved in cell wall biosynthesis